MDNVSVEVLRDEIAYDPASGLMVFKKSWHGKIKTGNPAFRTLRNDGYYVGNYRTRYHLAHRIVWAIEFGEWPEEIDHINGQRSDNRITNLRAVTRKENTVNKQMRRNNTSGVQGVCYLVRQKKWCAQIGRGRGSNLGLFDRKEDAVAARKAAEIERGYHPNHGRVVLS
jgi:hypothetical protein